MGREWQGTAVIYWEPHMWWLLCPALYLGVSNLLSTLWDSVWGLAQYPAQGEYSTSLLSEEMTGKKCFGSGRRKRKRWWPRTHYSHSLTQLLHHFMCHLFLICEGTCACRMLWDPICSNRFWPCTFNSTWYWLSLDPEAILYYIYSSFFSFLDHKYYSIGKIPPWDCI